MSGPLAGHTVRLKGRNILVPGNHDRCWQGHKDRRCERADYYRIGGIAKIIDNRFTLQPQRAGPTGL